jgi:BirA family biotin operon repressor/biotin-[acetyl-CoA-carboxylase] ligase
MMTSISRRAAIAAALSAAGPAGVSGEVIARELGISRVAVGKHIGALREAGYAIESVPRAGYRLLEAPDACIPEEVGPRLTHPLWVACEGGPETASTNDDAKRLARAGAAEGTVVVAGRQTGGKGRFGRTWTSPPGGVYASAVLRPPLAPSALGPLALVAALAVARALERFGVSAQLKWPNDVMAGGGKIAGILVEMAAEADSVEWLVAGIGVDVADPGTDGASWVRRYYADVGVADVAAAVLDELAAAYTGFTADGFPAVAEEYRQRGMLWGADVVVRDAAGGVVADGVAETVDNTGALVVSGADGRRVVVAGEVTLRG